MHTLEIALPGPPPSGPDIIQNFVSSFTPEIGMSGPPPSGPYIIQNFVRSFTPECQGFVRGILHRFLPMFGTPFQTVNTS